MISFAPLENRTIGDIATTLPGAAALLRGAGIAACCCTPERTLAEAAAAQGLPIDDLVAELRDRAEAVWLGTPKATEPLIEHIVARYHESHRAQLPALIALASEVETAEAERYEVPRGLSVLLDGLRAGLDEHMLREERRVFPLMLREPGDQLAQSLALMRDEHEDNAMFLLRAEHLTRGYRAPTGSTDCERLYVDLARFAEDLVAHVYIEERALFPRFEDLADQAAGRPQRS